jgi:trimeric autotransporter adhesin
MTRSKACKSVFALILFSAALSAASPARAQLNSGSPETPAQISGATGSTGAATATAPAAIPQATPTGGGTTNYIPKWTSSLALGNSVLFQSGSNIGIGTTTPTETLDVNGNSIFRGSFQLPPGHDATTSAGYESHSFQFQASSYNSSTKASTTQSFGFRAEPLKNNTSTPSAKLDLFFIPNGGSQFVDTGLSFAANGVITFASAQTFPITTGPAGPAGPPGPAASVITDGLTLFGDGSSGNPLRVYPDLSLSSLGATQIVANDPYTGEVAIRGTSTDGGYGLAGYGSETNGYGLYATGNIAIYSTSTNYAADFGGNVYVGGTLSKAGGSFKIDHPTDPENKYLSHSFVESPDMKNVYDGVVVTDASGYAIVTMPDWFEALNRDFRYQLTAVGQFAQAMIAKEIQDGKFTIQTDKPNVKVSWQITGIRQDAWANAHRIPVEEEKAYGDKGHYLHPELFGHEGEANIMQPKMPPQ